MQADLKDNRNCFVCGEKNAAGLHVRFALDDGRRTIEGRFVPRAEHEGWEGIVHGGVIAALLDEAMVKLAALLGMPSVSAELNVKFKAPARPGEELVVRGTITDIRGRLITAEASVERGPVLIAEAKAKLLKV